MALPTASDNVFPKIIGAEQGSTPANPSASQRKLYAKSDGWYDLDSSGTETGPFGTGSGSGGGGVLAAAKVARATSGSTSYGTASFSDFAENSQTLEVSFTSPSDGKVLIRLSINGGIGSNIAVRYRLYDTGAAAAVAGSYVAGPGALTQNWPHISWYLTLTGSTAYTFRPQTKAVSSAVNVFSGPGSADGDYGAIICEVLDAA